MRVKLWFGLAVYDKRDVVRTEVVELPTSRSRKLLRYGQRRANEEQLQAWATLVGPRGQALVDCSITEFA